MVGDDCTFEIREMVWIMLRILFEQMFHHRQLVVSVIIRRKVLPKQRLREIRDVGSMVN